MFFDDPVGDRQPQAGTAPGSLGCEERVEDVLRGGRIHPRTVVHNPDDDVAPVLLRRDPDLSPLISRHGLAGIDDQIDDDLLQLLGIAFEGRKVRPQVQLDVGELVDLIVDQARTLVDDVVDVDRVGQQSLILTGEGLETLDNPLDPFGTVGHVIDQGQDVLTKEVVLQSGDLEVWMTRLVFVDDRQDVVKCLLDDLDIAPDELVGVVDFVADSADQLTQGCQLVRLLQLLLVDLPVGDVPEELDDAVDLMIFVEDRQGMDLEELVPVLHLDGHRGPCFGDFDQPAIQAGSIQIEEGLVTDLSGHLLALVGHDQFEVLVDQGDGIRNRLEHRLQGPLRLVESPMRLIEV